MDSKSGKLVLLISLTTVLLSFPSAGVEFGVQPLWDRALPGAVNYVRIVGREILVGSGGNTITLLTTTGRILWAKTFESGITGIALSNDYVGVSLTSGELILLDHGGERIWSRRTDSYIGYADALLLIDDGFYAGDMSGVISLFDLSGNLLWKGTSDAYVISLNRLDDTVLAVSDKGVYVLEDSRINQMITVDGYVRAARLETELSALSSSGGEIIIFDAGGEALWNKSLGETVGTVYSSSDGVVAGSREENIHVFDENGEARWSNRLDGSITKVYLNAEYVIAGSTNNKVYAFNWRGRPVWVNTEDSGVSDFDANEVALVYGTSQGRLKYFVLTSKSTEQAYIAGALIGVTLLAGFVMLVMHWRHKG
ncbi:MAG: PQQ-binding-like beta-propeller repeat protein [Candidatus Altiarchaeota archaeon]